MARRSGCFAGLITGRVGAGGDVVSGVCCQGNHREKWRLMEQKRPRNANGTFGKGGPPPAARAHRQRGVSNKITRDIRDGAIAGFARHGSNGRGEGGFAGYCFSFGETPSKGCRETDRKAAAFDGQRHRHNRPPNRNGERDLSPGRPLPFRRRYRANTIGTAAY